MEINKGSDIKIKKGSDNPLQRRQGASHNQGEDLQIQNF